MSAEGIRIVAGIFEKMQQDRVKLLQLASRDPASKHCHQDMRLAQLLADAKDAVKEEFIRAVDFKWGNKGK